MFVLLLNVSLKSETTNCSTVPDLIVSSLEDRHIIDHTNYLVSGRKVDMLCDWGREASIEDCHFTLRELGSVEQEDGLVVDFSQGSQSEVKWNSDFTNINKTETKRESKVHRLRV